MILRHIWQEAMDEVEHLRHTFVNRALYRKRQETIERVFADTKEKHGMRWARYRGLKKTTLQAMLTFSALNLKKLANCHGIPIGILVFQTILYDYIRQPLISTLK